MQSFTPQTPSPDKKQNKTNKLIDRPPFLHLDWGGWVTHGTTIAAAIHWFVIVGDRPQGADQWGMWECEKGEGEREGGTGKSNNIVWVNIQH